MPDLLVAEGLSKRYGGVVAAQGVNITIPTAGYVLGLIGPNGAGKSTTINLLSGATLTDTGSVTLDGQDVTRLGAARRSRVGLARTFQSSLAFNDATVEQNLHRAAVAASADGRWWLDFGPRRKLHGQRMLVAESLLDRLGLRQWADTRASDLPYGTLRLMSIAMAMVGEPRVLLLDEPAAGLNNRETEALQEVIEELAASGVAVLLVEHDVRLVMAVSDSIVVLDAGKPIATGTPDEVRRDSRVIEAFLGGGDEAQHN